MNRAQAGLPTVQGGGPAELGDDPHDLAKQDYDPDRDAVRIEYEEGDRTVGFWLVPDCAEVLTVDGEPAIRRSEMALLLGQGVEVARYVLGVLRAFPGASLRSIGGQGVGR